MGYTDGLHVAGAPRKKPGKLKASRENEVFVVFEIIAGVF
jgi:hypothetical protein